MWIFIAKRLSTRLDSFGRFLSGKSIRFRAQIGDESETAAGSDSEEREERRRRLRVFSVSFSSASSAFFCYLRAKLKCDSSALLLPTPSADEFDCQFKFRRDTSFRDIR